MLIRKQIMMLLLIYGIRSVGAYEYQGTVYGQGSSKPIKNVLVSIGHSRIRTLTDEEGRFFLDTTETGVKNSVKRNDRLKIFWNNRSGFMDLVNGTSINKISIYDLNGRELHKSDLSAKSRKIIVPLLAKGIYLLRVGTINGVNYNFKVNTAMPSALLILNKDYSFQKNASVAKPVKLLFRHDNYFPVDYQITDTDQDIVIVMKDDPRGEFFNQNKINSFDFTISVEDSIEMEKNALFENYIPAQMKFDGKDFGKVGLRYKGSQFSLSNCFDSETGDRIKKKECSKISLKVKFNKFEDSLRFFQMKALNLHSMFGDGSKMHDMIGYQMFRDMGIYSPRTTYTTISINGVFQGIYVAVEAVDGRFTKSRWPEDGDGNLYKEAWPWVDSSDYYLNHLETNKDSADNADVCRMVDFYNAVNKSTQETFTANLEPFIDFDYLIRYLAVDRAIKNWDGITGWYKSDDWFGNHNYFFYEEEKTDGKIWLIPWDLDNTFILNDPFIDDANVPNWNESSPGCEPMDVFSGTSKVVSSSCDKFTSMTAANYWKEFVKTGNELLRKIFIPDNLINKVDKYITLIDSIIINDPHVEYEIWKNEVSILKRNLVSLQKHFYNYINEIKEIIDTTDYCTPFEGNGRLVLDRINNFEFAPAEGEFEFANIDKPMVMKGNVIHSTENPISCTADLLFSFIFNSLEDDASYSEWIKATIKMAPRSNIEKCKEIRMTLSADRQRYLWFGLYSSSNDQYGWAVYVNDVPKTYSFKIDEISYPVWDISGDPGLLGSVLKSCSGINFSPGAAFDSNGELTNGPDTGFLRIDNIKFVF